MIKDLNDFAKFQTQLKAHIMFNHRSYDPITTPALRIRDSFDRFLKKRAHRAGCHCKANCNFCCTGVVQLFFSTIDAHLICTVLDMALQTNRSWALKVLRTAYSANVIRCKQDPKYKTNWTGGCPFAIDGFGCMIYQFRPEQCIGYYADPTIPCEFRVKEDITPEGKKIFHYGLFNRIDLDDGSLESSFKKMVTPEWMELAKKRYVCTPSYILYQMLKKNGVDDLEECDCNFWASSISEIQPYT
jgi:hypothetical protein